MTFEVINQQLLLEEKPLKKGRQLTIKKDNKGSYLDQTRLSDVFNCLPHGFVFKETTGMGGTTLELDAKRHSIIVEPIRITASSKAHKHNALYVGSSTRYHPNKAISVEDIKKYIDDETVLYKKIVVVADSLPKVIEAIVETVFKDFFIVIDEIDSFQLDSSYRKNMEICMDYYKSFLPTNRAMLSATRIDFTDPQLAKEPITYIKYDKAIPRDILVITTFTPNIPGIIVDTIKETIANFPNDKIFIAYNSVNGCFNIAEHLVNESVITKEQVKIFCSNASEAKAPDYYQELDSDKLPVQVNFFTSAYFTGFDLHESYHLISISCKVGNGQSLSDRRFKQIAGRSRTGILSETIIHDFMSKDKVNNITRKSLIEAGISQRDSHRCMTRHYGKSGLLQTVIHEINEQFLTILENNKKRYIRTDENKEFQISYFSIDNQLEEQRVRNELYLKQDTLYNKLLSDGNNVTHQLLISSTKVEDKKVSIIERDREVEDIIDTLRNFDFSHEILEFLKKERLTPIQVRIATDFQKLLDYLDKNDTLDKIKDSILGKRDLRVYNRLIMAAFFVTEHPDSLVKARLDVYFPIGNRYDNDEIQFRMELYVGEIHKINNVKSLKESKKLLKLFRKTYKKRDPKTSIDYIHIKGNNPMNFVVNKTKKSFKENNLLDTLTSFSSVNRDDI